MPLQGGAARAHQTEAWDIRVWLAGRVSISAMKFISSLGEPNQLPVQSTVTALILDHWANPKLSTGGFPGIIPGSYAFATLGCTGPRSCADPLRLDSLCFCVSRLSAY